MRLLLRIQGQGLARQQLCPMNELTQRVQPCHLSVLILCTWHWPQAELLPGAGGWEQEPIHLQPHTAD
jgi:hypothetical protein